MATELLTPRLRLRPWSAADAEPMIEINRDPEVARYLNRPVDEQALRAFGPSMVEHWHRHGYGVYAVLEREDDAFAGFVGIAHPLFLEEVARRPELGWRLARSAWGRGLATEAAAAVRDHAFSVLGMTELISIIHPDNERSRRVATKLGMTVERQVHNPVLGIDVDVWQAAAPDD